MPAKTLQGGFMPLHETLDPKHSEAELARFKDQCLQDPPPPGYVLYAGLGDPVSDSSRTYAPKIYQLVCEHLQARKSSVGKSYFGLFERNLSQEPGFESMECVEPFSMAVVGRFNFWDTTLRDKWLQAPEPNWLPSPFPAGSHVHPKIFHRWVWQALPAFTFRDDQ